jgi:hypothetical protein
VLRQYRNLFTEQELAQAATKLSTTALLSTHSIHAETKSACILILKTVLFSFIPTAYYCCYSVSSHIILHLPGCDIHKIHGREGRMLSQRNMQSEAYTHDDICVSM